MYKRILAIFIILILTTGCEKANTNKTNNDNNKVTSVQMKQEAQTKKVLKPTKTNDIKILYYTSDS